MRCTSWLTLALLASLAGCASPEGAFPETYQISDWELKRSGEWTGADAEARRLIGSEWGSSDYRPVRLPPLWRKFIDPRSAVATLLGTTYEKRYHYVPDEGKYVLLRRDASAVIVDESWQGEPEPDTDPEVWSRVRRDLEQDLERVFSTGTEPDVLEP